MPFAGFFRSVPTLGYWHSTDLGLLTLGLLRLKSSLAKYDDLLDEWLAGPEASGPAFSVEYIAFSAMRMGVDCL